MKILRSIVGIFSIFGLSSIGNRTGRDEMARMAKENTSPKMGWKKNLAYAAILIAVVVGYRVWSERAGPRFDERLQKIEADMKKTLPRKIDEDTTLVDVKYEPTRTAFWYVVNSRLDPHQTEVEIKKQACANADVVRTIRDKNFTYEYHYANAGDVNRFAFTIASCP